MSTRPVTRSRGDGTAGAPVTVFFSKAGDKMVATKVVVKKTTTTQPRG